MTNPIIKVTELKRHFGKTIALDGLNFEVPPGSVTGLLGPNGAGKSTTIQILIGMLRRHGGNVQVLGQDPEHQEVSIREKTGFVPEDPHFEPRFSVRECLDFVKSFRPGWDQSLEQDLLSSLDLNVSKKVRSLSRGQRAKLALISALSFKPELLILDDPTSGLDPLARREFNQGIVEVLASEGKTVFYSSHQVDEIERVADRIIMVKEGRLLFAGEIDKIRKSWRLIRLSFPHGEAPGSLQLPGIRNWNPEGRSGLVLFNNFNENSKQKLADLDCQQELLPLSLEDIYVDLARHGEEVTK